jgi:hypothetical protein
MVNPPRLVSVLKPALKTLLLVGLKVAHFCSRCSQLTAGTVRQDAGTVRERVAEFAQTHLHHSLAQLFGKARLQLHTEMWHNVES